MTKKTILSTLLLVILTAVTFNSCSSDDGGDSCGKIENAEKGLERAIQLGLIEQTCFEEGKEEMV